jgi:hypothetical protein
MPPDRHRKEIPMKAILAAALIGGFSFAAAAGV